MITDPLHWRSRQECHWTTANIGEALPGVSTPFNASLWGDAIAEGMVAGACAAGAVSNRERTGFLGRPDKPLVAFFHGRAAVDADFLAMLGDRMPGSDGRDVVAGIFGEVPATMTFHPTIRRYPMTALRLPATFLKHPNKVRDLVTDYDRWWRTRLAALESADYATAVCILDEAGARMRRAVIVHTVAVLTCVQPVYEVLGQVVARAGSDDYFIISAPGGGAESAVVSDLWAASRDRLTVQDVIARHGFHGPNEGEISSRVWRETPSVVEKLVDQYRERTDSESPDRREVERAELREAAVHNLIESIGTLERPVARAVLRLVETRMPLRGMAKRSMLQALDVNRAAARQVGRHLAGIGRLDEPDDIFHLTFSEAITVPQDARELVRGRRRLRSEHALIDVPILWRGAVENVGVRCADSVAPSHPQPCGEDILSGIGVSSGVVEGRARVVTDPTFADVESDEILIASTTDPSWSSIMYVSRALVVDIGGPLSHAAVVARELNIPCVVNTGIGTRALRTGDLIRVDGGTGRIDILDRALGR